MEQRDEFDTNGIDCLESKFNEYLVRVENKTTFFHGNPIPESLSTPLPLLQTPDCIMETEETVNDLLTSDIEVVTTQ